MKVPFRSSSLPVFVGRVFYCTFARWITKPVVPNTRYVTRLMKYNRFLGFSLCHVILILQTVMLAYRTRQDIARQCNVRDYQDFPSSSHRATQQLNITIFSVHISHEMKNVVPLYIDWFKNKYNQNFGPVGARDLATLDFLGVEAYLSSGSSS